MKRMLAIVACGLLAAVMVRAQSSSSPKPYKVVFDLTTDDPQDQTAVLRWLREVASVNSQNEMEVVNVRARPRRSSSLVARPSGDEVKQAIGRPRVSFKVCEIAMRNQKLEKSQLLPNVATVPDGIGEIVARQKEGWGYIKAVAH
jgi:intracellular sulfur oxidation DsrE/DsrF family protein